MQKAASVSVKVSKVRPRTAENVSGEGLEKPAWVCWWKFGHFPSDIQAIHMQAKVCLQTANYSSLHRFTTPPHHTDSQSGKRI